MAYTTLISATELVPQLSNPDWVVVDCRFSLDDTGRGRRAYQESHIPGAVYAHLDEDLSGSTSPGETGRHPLPEVADIRETLSAWGVGNFSQVIVYDDSGGSIAARLWWMLNWLGHRQVALLDGGWQAWLATGGQVRSGEEIRPAREFIPRVRAELLVSTEEVFEHLGDPSWRLVDARAPERFRGEAEPIDPVAGRIPGAVNAPHMATAGPDGRFRTPDELRRWFAALLEGVPAGQSVFYCGSGVSAARTMLALAHAGLGEGRLYAGSWSEWITDPQRPIQTGEPTE